MVTGTTDEPDEEHAAVGVHHGTPSMPVRPVAEDVHERRTTRGRRQMVQNALGAVGTAIAAGLGANAAGLVTNVGGQLLQQGVAVVGGVGGGGSGGGGLAAAAVGHGGNRKQVVLHVTRVEKVLDDRVTVTLVPKNCVPAAGQVHALRPCAGAGYHQYAVAGQPYHHDQQTDDEERDEEEQQLPQTDDVASIVSQVDGLVHEMVGSRTIPAPVFAGAPAGHHGHRYRVTDAPRPLGAGQF